LVAFYFVGRPAILFALSSVTGSLQIFQLQRKFVSAVLSLRSHL
jgi:hypothetical protein